MRQLCAFELENGPDSPGHPAGIKIALLRYSPGRDGCLVITLACTSYEEGERARFVQ
jgi:hypothetical protein